MTDREGGRLSPEITGEELYAAGDEEFISEHTCVSAIVSGMSSFGGFAVSAASDAIEYITPSSDAIDYITPPTMFQFNMLPTWNAAFGASVTVLRTGAYSVPRDISSIRMLTENGIPTWMPTLPSGVRCHSHSEPPGEWYYGLDSLWTTNLEYVATVQQGKKPPYMLYFHGGAFCCCNTTTHRHLLMKIVECTGAVIFALDYQRPPEFPYPIPVNDGVDAYAWLLKYLEPSNIIFAGDSAGGGLVVSAVVEAVARRSMPPPAGAILLSPWVDLEDSGISDSWTRNEKYDFILPDLTKLFAESYKGSSTWEEVSPTLSPHLNLLPPVLIECGDSEVLVDQIVAFADKCKQAGVDVDIQVREEMVHVFCMLSFANMPQCEQAYESMATFIEKVVPGWRAPSRGPGGGTRPLMPAGAGAAAAAAAAAAATAARLRVPPAIDTASEMITRVPSIETASLASSSGSTLDTLSPADSVAAFPRLESENSSERLGAVVSGAESGAGVEAGAADTSVFESAPAVAADIGPSNLSSPYSDGAAAVSATDRSTSTAALIESLRQQLRESNEVREALQRESAHLQAQLWDREREIRMLRSLPPTLPTAMPPVPVPVMPVVPVATSSRTPRGSLALGTEIETTGVGVGVGAASTAGAPAGGGGGGTPLRLSSNPPIATASTEATSLVAPPPHDLSSSAATQLQIPVHPSSPQPPSLHPPQHAPILLPPDMASGSLSPMPSWPETAAYASVPAASSSPITPQPWSYAANASLCESDDASFELHD